MMPGAEHRIIGWLILAAASALLGIYLHAAISNPHIGFVADDALYLLMADIYSPFKEAAGPVYEHVRAYSQLPPFFPVLVGLLGGGTESVALSKALAASFMVLAHLLLFVWLRMQGLRQLAAMAFVAAFATLPFTLIHVVDVWSEGLYMALVWAAFILYARAETAHFSVWLCLACGALTACAIATRTIGMALLPALLHVMWIAGLRKSGYVALGVVAVGVLLNPLDMGHVGDSYGSQLSRTYLNASLADVFDTLAGQLSACWTALSYVLFQKADPTPAMSVALALALVLGAFGWVRDVPARPRESSYVLAYLLIVAVWPFPEVIDRLLLPILPFLAFYALRGALGGNRSNPSMSRVRIFALLLPLLLIVAPSAIATWQQMYRPLPIPALDSFRTSRFWLDTSRIDPALTEIRYLAAIEAAMPMIADNVPGDECVYTFAPQLVMAKARRVAWFPPPLKRLEEGPPWTCPHFFLLGNPIRGHEPYYPLHIIAEQVRSVTTARVLPPPSTQSPDTRAVAILVRQVRGHD